MLTITEARVYNLLEEDNTTDDDVERVQLFFVIARTETLWNAFRNIYDCKTHCLKEGWDRVIDGRCAKMLVRAAHLFNSFNDDIPTVELFRGLDDYNTETMIKAEMIFTRLCNYCDTTK